MSEPRAGSLSGRSRHMSGRSLRHGGISLAWLIALIVLIPAVVVVWHAAQPTGEVWSQVMENRLPGYLGHTLLLGGAVTVLAVLLGVPAAWFISVYQFPGRRVLEVALLLPLAMPGFVAAVAYVEWLQHLTPFYVWVRGQFGVAAFSAVQEMASWVFGVVVLATTLFPYVYLSCRAVFVRQAGAVLESARLLGSSGWRTFWTVAVPLARPAIAAGGSLVAMEALNDYGVVSYFGLGTLTPGIFRLWGEGHLGAAMRLAALLALLVVIGLMIERGQRGRCRFAQDPRDAPLAAKKLPPQMTLLAWGICGVPLLLGFGLPLVRLALWSLRAHTTAEWGKNLAATANTFALALGAAVLVALGAVILVGAHRAWRSPSLKLAQRLGLLGYAYPGALVAVGMGAFVSSLAFDFPGWGGLALSASAFGLMLAYFIRFLAVGIQPVSAGFERVSGQLHEAARTLGATPLRALGRVDLPLVKPAIFAGATLAFIDVFKELTMTLVLRPFDFETLATLTFRLTDESRIPEAAIPGLFILVFCLPGLIPLTLLLRKK